MDTVRHASHGALLRFGAAAGFFCALALTGAARASTPPIPAANLFTNLHPCEFAGLRERMISRGARTQTFAGELARVQVREEVRRGDRRGARACGTRERESAEESGRCAESEECAVRGVAYGVHR